MTDFKIWALMVFAFGDPQEAALVAPSFYPSKEICLDAAREAIVLTPGIEEPTPALEVHAWFMCVPVASPR